MHAQIHTIAFRGIETIAVTVQIHIALGLMVAMGVVPRDAVEYALVLGELALDGAIQPVSGVLPVAIAAAAASRDLIRLANHLKSDQLSSPPPTITSPIRRGFSLLRQ